jgi:hypothetical protein
MTRRFIVMLVTLGLFALPLTALAKDGGKGQGNGNGNGHGQSTAAAHRASGSEAGGDDQADEASGSAAPEAGEADDDSTETPDAPKANKGNKPDKHAGGGAADATDTAPAATKHGHTPTAHAQQVLADLVASGKLPAHAVDVLLRVIAKLQAKHG